MNSLLQCNKKPVSSISKYRWLLLSCFSALLLIFSFPDPGISWLGWIALIPLFYVIQTEKYSKVVFSGLITGVLFNVVYLMWMKEYKHPLALSGGVFGEMIFFMSAVLLSRFLFKNLTIISRKKSRPIQPPARALTVVSSMRVVMLPVGWLTVDYIKTIGFLAFPWGILGYTQYKNLVLIQTASIFGIWGITFIMLYFNSAVSSLLIDIINRRNFKKINRVSPLSGRRIFSSGYVHLSIAAALVLFSIIFGVIKLAEEKKGFLLTKRIALIQANFDPWSPKTKENITTVIRLTGKALKEDPDLIVWSESSVPFYYEYYLKKNNKHARRIHNYIRRIHKPFIFGTIEFQGQREGKKFQGNFYNVAIYYNNGKLQDVYRKIHLVPFGEWFPYKRLFPFVVRILENAGAGDFTPGQEYVIFNGGDYSFNTLICFEDVLGTLARKFILRGSELQINVTNDAWTGSRKAEIQHYSISVFRTIENRRSLVRAANGGVTACINPYGRQLEQLELFATDYLVCDVPIVGKDTITFYSRCGDVLAYFVTIFSGFLLVYLVMKIIIDRIVKKHIMLNCECEDGISGENTCS